MFMDTSGYNIWSWKLYRKALHVTHSAGDQKNHVIIQVVREVWMSINPTHWQKLVQLGQVTQGCVQPSFYDIPRMDILPVFQFLERNIFSYSWKCQLFLKCPQLCKQVAAKAKVGPKCTDWSRALLSKALNLTTYPFYHHKHLQQIFWNPWILQFYFLKCNILYLGHQTPLQ